jgi:hypothetical protein
VWKTAAALLISISIAAPVAAQDQGLDAFLFSKGLFSEDATELQARGIQLYRLPLSFHLRSLDEHAWGLRVTFPLSLSSLRIEGVSGVANFVRKLGIAAIVPGVEVEIPAGTRTLIRPFGEAGIGRSSGELTEVLYGAGVRVRTSQDLGSLHLTYGGTVFGRKTPALVGTFDRYASFEGGIDAQVPLGFTIWDKPARAGVYTIGRAFDGLELQRTGRPPIILRGQLEAGVSFSTTPDFRIWKIKLPWLAAGYQFGHTVSGVRIYMVFPY